VLAWPRLRATTINGIPFMTVLADERCDCLGFTARQNAFSARERR